MGAADLVPGISGGTVAFILGFYQELLESLKSINGTTLRMLCRFQWKAFSRCVAWPFLLTLASGIACAFLILAGPLHAILKHETYRVFLYAGFMGLILASFVLCLKELKQWSLPILSGFMLGVVSAYLLTSTTLSPPQESLYVQDYDHRLIHPWLIFCGAIAVCALLLPGISGSYLLTLLGVYGQAIGALAAFSAGLKIGVVEWEALILLSNLLVGILFGAFTFARFASWLLKRYPDMSLAVLAGFMVGALRSVWPFWSYTHTQQRVQLIPLEPIWPEWNGMVWGALGMAIVGFCSVILLDTVSKKPFPERGHEQGL